MTDPIVSVASISFDDTSIGNVIANLESPRRMMGQVAVVMESEVKRRFIEESRDPNEWEPRGVPNIAGIMHDFEDGLSAPKDTRFVDRPVLVDDNDLFRGIRGGVEGDDVAVVGPSGPSQSYADKQHFGLESVAGVITREFQDWLSDYLHEGGGEQWIPDLEWMLDPIMVDSEVKITPRARPIYVLDAEGFEIVTETIEEDIVKPHRGSA